MVQNQNGFTLIELMITVAIIGILSTVVVPQFASLVRKSQESTTKANLGSLRSALAIYYGDLEGWYPTDDLTSLVPRYISSIPMKNTPPYHRAGNLIQEGTLGSQIGSPADWFYFGEPYSKEWGSIIINCVHQDLSGRVWASY